MWEKDELVIQAVEAEKGLPDVEILEDLQKFATCQFK